MRPLLRIRQTEAATGTAGAQPLDLTGLESRPAPGTPPCERVFGSLRHYLLGYDLDPADLRRLLVEQRRLGEISPAADAGLLRCEDGLLDLFAEVGGLYRPRTETQPDDALTATSTQEYLLAYLQWLDPDRAGLPEAYRSRLEAALARYGATEPASGRPASRPRSCGCSGRSAASTSSFPWCCRSWSVACARSPRSHRWRTTRCVPGSSGIATSAQGRHPAVAELARDVRFRYFDEPVLEASGAAEYDETERVMDAVEADPEGAGREAVRASRALAAAPAWCPAASLAGRDRPRVPEGAARGLRPAVLPDPRAARPALRRARRPAAVRGRLRLGEQAHPPRRRLRRARPAAGRRRAPWPRTWSTPRATVRSSST